LLNSIYSSVSPDFRFKETPYVNFYTDPELSSSLYLIFNFHTLFTITHNDNITLSLSLCMTWEAVVLCFLLLLIKNAVFHLDNVF